MDKRTVEGFLDGPKNDATSEGQDNLVFLDSITFSTASLNMMSPSLLAALIESKETSVKGLKTGKGKNKSAADNSANEKKGLSPESVRSGQEGKTSASESLDSSEPDLRKSDNA